MPRMFSMCVTAVTAGLLASAFLTGCQPDYSPNTYASAAAQLANKVDQGVVVGVRAIQISADTTLATGTGAAAGGIAGSQVGGTAGSAFGALTGSVAGGVAGSVIGHAEGDTNGFEYIVRKDNGDLLSVTQKDVAPLGIGAHVLIIEGPQARVVADYTVPVISQPLHPDAAKPAAQPEAPKAGTATSPAVTPASPQPADASAKPVETAPLGTTIVAAPPAPALSAATPAPTPVTTSGTPAPAATPMTPPADTPAKAGDTQAK